MLGLLALGLSYQVFLFPYPFCSLIEKQKGGIGIFGTGWEKRTSPQSHAPDRDARAQHGHCSR